MPQWRQDRAKAAGEVLSRTEQKHPSVLVKPWNGIRPVNGYGYSKMVIIGVDPSINFGGTHQLSDLSEIGIRRIWDIWAMKFSENMRIPPSKQWYVSVGLTFRPTEPLCVCVLLISKHSSLRARLWPSKSPSSGCVVGIVSTMIGETPGITWISARKWVW